MALLASVATPRLAGAGEPAGTTGAAPGAAATAGSSAVVTPTQPARKLLADVFFHEGDWFRAIGEYRRAIHESDDARAQQRWWLRIGVCYARARRYADASRIFSQVQAQGGDLAGHACYHLALAWIDGGLGQLAKRQLATCRALPEAVAVAGVDRLDLAEAGGLFAQRQFAAAVASLRGYEGRHPGSPLVAAAADLRTAAEEGSRYVPYSPLAAGLMSAVVPGLGQFYQGRSWDGFQALVLVGTLGVTTAALAKNEVNRKEPNWLLPIAVGTVAAAFYGANVYGAANGARMESMVQEVRLIDRVRGRWRPALEVDLP